MVPSHGIQQWMYLTLGGGRLPTWGPCLCDGQKSAEHPSGSLSLYCHGCEWSTTCHVSCGETFAWKKSWNGSVMKSIDMELYLHSGRSSSLLVPKWIQRNLLKGNVLDNKESIAKLQYHFQELVIAVNMESNAIGQGLLPVRNSHRV